MKGFYITVLFLCTLFNNGINVSSKMAEDIEGAWELLSTEGVPTKGNITFMAVDGYAFYSIYDIESKTFMGSMGGKMSAMRQGLERL